MGGHTGRVVKLLFNQCVIVVNFFNVEMPYRELTLFQSFGFNSAGGRGVY